VIPLFAGRWGG